MPTAAELHVDQLEGQLRDLDVMLKRAQKTQNGKEESIKLRIAHYEAQLKAAKGKPAK